MKKQHDEPTSANLAASAEAKVADAIVTHSQIMLMIHFNERYHEISVKYASDLDSAIIQRTSELQERESRQGTQANTQYVNNFKLIKYYLAYWLLQWDQFVSYQRGALPRWIFETWLRERYEKYNMAGRFQHVVNLTPKKASGDLRASLWAAEVEQEFYRDGWTRAKEFYCELKKGFDQFAKQLDIIMTSPEEMEREEAIARLLDRGFLTNQDRDVAQ